MNINEWVSHLQSIPISTLRWSILCPGKMYERSPFISSNITSLSSTNSTIKQSMSKTHHIHLQNDFPPISSLAIYITKNILIPLRHILGVLTLVPLALYWGGTYLEDIADRLAVELKEGGEEYVGRRLGVQQVQHR